MSKFTTLALIIFISGFVFSCAKTAADFTPQGGLLPTNYITVQDSGFSPAILSVVSGSSITFVNNTGIPHTIRTEDSVTIPPVTIPTQSSFFFKKDTSGTFRYYCTTHPTARGTIIITP